MQIRQSFTLDQIDFCIQVIDNNIILSNFNPTCPIHGQVLSNPNIYLPTIISILSIYCNPAQYYFMKAFPINTATCGPVLADLYRKVAALQR